VGTYSAWPDIPGYRVWSQSEWFFFKSAVLLICLFVKKEKKITVNSSFIWIFIVPVLIFFSWRYARISIDRMMPEY
jgi:hypothetical protein